MTPTENAVDVALVDEFHDFLMGGKVPGGITLTKRPRKMTAAQSMAVIYVLQEFLHVIPDIYEMCEYCGRIFDTESEGHIAEDGNTWCDNCAWKCQCKSCKELGR